MEAHGVNYPFPEGLAFEDKRPIAQISVPPFVLLCYEAMNEAKALGLFPLAIFNPWFTLVNWKRR
jgi:hypothetical protein